MNKKRLNTLEPGDRFILDGDPQEYVLREFNGLKGITVCGREILSGHRVIPVNKIIDPYLTDRIGKTSDGKYKIAEIPGSNQHVAYYIDQINGIHEGTVTRFRIGGPLGIFDNLGDFVMLEDCFSSEDAAREFLRSKST
jgi:hypothetical protein